jgi:N-acyl-L-homoserine lactone synthetase
MEADMQVSSLTASEMNAKNFRQLKDTMHKHRYQQFCDRLGWGLPKNDHPYEVDQFDDSSSRYIYVHDDNVHVASVRLRHANFGTMIESCFFRQLPKTQDFILRNRAKCFEITRLVTAPSADTIARRNACKALLETLKQEMNRERGSFYIAGVSAPASRLLARCDLRTNQIESGQIEGSLVFSVLVGSSLQ